MQISTSAFTICHFFSAPLFCSAHLSSRCVGDCDRRSEARFVGQKVVQHLNAFATIVLMVARFTSHEPDSLTTNITEYRAIASEMLCLFSALILIRKALLEANKRITKSRQPRMTLGQ